MQIVAELDGIQIIFSFFKTLRFANEKLDIDCSLQKSTWDNFTKLATIYFLLMPMISYEIFILSKKEIYIILKVLSEPRLKEQTAQSIK